VDDRFGVRVCACVCCFGHVCRLMSEEPLDVEFGEEAFVRACAPKMKGVCIERKKGGKEGKGKRDE
jgi:hypothetical protein